MSVNAEVSAVCISVYNLTDFILRLERENDELRRDRLEQFECDKEDFQAVIGKQRLEVQQENISAQRKSDQLKLLKEIHSAVELLVPMIVEAEGENHFLKQSAPSKTQRSNSAKAKVTSSESTTEAESDGLVIAKPTRSKSADHIHTKTAESNIEGGDSKSFEEKVMSLGEANEWASIVALLKEETRRQKPEMGDAQWTTLSTELQDIATSSYANRFNTWQKIFNSVGSYNIHVRKLVYQAYQEI